MHPKPHSEELRSAYEGVDSLDRFSTPAVLDTYREALLASSEKEVAFIHACIGERRARVLEIGSGSGRLLIALARTGQLRSGVGIDIARSRVEFAQRWAEDLQLDTLRFAAGDAVDPAAWPAGQFDVVLCVSNMFGYLRPLSPEAPREVLDRLWASLAPGGCLLIEAYHLNQRRRDVLRLSSDRLRVWMPLPAADRFALYLSDLFYDADTGVLRHEKTFVGRDGTIESGRVEQLAYHHVSELSDWLREHGARAIHVYGDFDGQPFDEETSDRFILIAGAGKWSMPAAPQSEPAIESGANRGLSDGPGAWV